MAERLTREEIRVLMGPADDVSITELVDLGMTRAELTGHAARASRPRSPGRGRGRQAQAPARPRRGWKDIPWQVVRAADASFDACRG
jgi:hypothetical protein